MSKVAVYKESSIRLALARIAIDLMGVSEFCLSGYNSVNFRARSIKLASF